MLHVLKMPRVQRGSVTALRASQYLYGITDSGSVLLFSLTVCQVMQYRVSYFKSDVLDAVSGLSCSFGHAHQKIVVRRLMLIWIQSMGVVPGM